MEFQSIEVVPDPIHSTTSSTSFHSAKFLLSGKAAELNDTVGDNGVVGNLLQYDECLG